MSTHIMLGDKIFQGGPNISKLMDWGSKYYGGPNIPLQAMAGQHLMVGSDTENLEWTLDRAPYIT